MKLAAALNERADTQRRIEELKKRLMNNAKTQEGTEPAEEPRALLKELDKAISSLEKLTRDINLTNTRVLADGLSLTALLARRDALKIKVEYLREFLNRASEKVDRFTRSEIVIISTVDVKETQKQADRLSKELRKLDEKIQEINWTNELEEN